MVMEIFGKNEHGLRLRDLDRTDMQNFEAAERIIRASHLLVHLPDAVGMKHYIDVISCSIYSFLDMDMTPLDHLQHIWYAAIFLRYWRTWLLSKPHFKLKDNFISSNAHMCVELNAHSLLMYLLLLRDNYPQHSSSFSPWMIGSQSCEKIFRTLHGMTGTFSTMVNFSMLGLLQRLHKLDILEELQSEETHKIVFPRQEKYGRKKHGTRSPKKKDPTQRNVQMQKKKGRAKKRHTSR